MVLLPNLRLKLTARGGRMVGDRSVLSAAAAGRSLSAIRYAAHWATRFSRRTMASILLIIVFFAPGFYSGAKFPYQGQDPDKARPGDELFSIDLLKCQPLSKRFGWGRGYDNIEVKGKERNRCVIRKVTAWEADYTVSECRPKTSLKRLAIIKGRYITLDSSRRLKVLQGG